jgi:conjugal transfer pilus assembly protein TraW
VVFRGVGEGESIDAFAARRLVGRDAAPATIDPRPFREHGVDVVPAVLDRDTGVLVFGVGDPDALAGRNHHEHLGPVVAIAEPDLAEVMKARALAIDWNARMTASVDSWLRRARFERLTPAPQDHVRRIDARVVLAEDFVLRDGRVLARAGDTFDPTAIQPLSLTLIAFDPRKAAEVDVVADLLPGIAQPILMATQIDPVEGWDTFARLRARFGHPVYLLMPDVRSRFSLRHTVSVVTGGPGWFEVREIAARSAASAEMRP